MIPRGEVRETLALAVPLAAQQLGFQLMGVVDAALLGRYSDAALAGATVGNNLLFAITSVAFGVVMGLDIVIPQRLGAGLPVEARRALCRRRPASPSASGSASMLLVLVSPYILVLAQVDFDVRSDGDRVHRSGAPPASRCSSSASRFAATSRRAA